LLAALSQELCRQLTTLRAGFDLILGESPSPMAEDQRQQLLTIVSRCDELIRFTRSFLDYAVIAHGSRPLEVGAFTLGALINEIDRQFASIAHSRRIRLETRVKDPQAAILTDASRCQQIVGNVVSNALNYTPSGGYVHVSAEIELSSWHLSVADSGPGIP